MLQVIKCPNCRGLIETDQVAGQTIPCPHCEQAFEIQPELVVPSRNLRNAIIKLCIPLGYVLFVAVPIGLTIWYFASRAEEQAKNEPPTEVKEKQKPAPAPAPKKREKKGPVEEPEETLPPNPNPRITDPGHESEARPVPKKVPDDTPVIEPEPIAIAPLPREVTTPVAPEPRRVYWKIPLLEYSSEWQKVGLVDLRIAGLAVSKVPFADREERITDSSTPLLVIVIEVRRNASGKQRELLSWANTGYAALFVENGKSPMPLEFPSGKKPYTGFVPKQTIPEDGTAVRDVLFFTLPAEGSGELSLRLDGDRCGENKDIWFKIPATALKK